MTTALDLITGAAKLAGVVFKSETLDSDEANDGLTSLNDMIASWGNNTLLIQSRTWESFTVSAASSFTIGTGQTLNTTRPTSIVNAFFRSGGIDYSMNPMDDWEYERIPLKTVGSPFPEWFDYDNAYPYGTIRVYTALSTGAELHLLSEKPVSSFSSLTDTVNLAPGWNRAIRYNLAMEMAPEYGVELRPEVVRIAALALKDIQLAIAKNRPIKFHGNVVREKNIYTGYW